MENQTFMNGVIDRFEENKAVIKLDDGQQVIWPASELPERLTEGDNLRLVLSTVGDGTAEREEMAKAVLNKILKDKNPNE
ncbi:DUF3006 domain-containing protein [Candidatus Saccharibacteria bacterium]|nr:DUF3006 domain-containing protein [Candidatus Saccharibacteria bacterium]NIS38472.1 DUF3006 domain-containing protein [Candidatus Saccharibacteria bacterium]NIV04413.1 DUF3006 family protein [Calditrichia bacterium]NIV72962.1 DUF3006 family protein [Calditrichia bacterium]NIW80555.1 DUF3006 family protein [Calditrichia bacterium]